ncbi:MAG: type VI secretion system tip protein VgrG [Proteobacteria bacterium]|nr:type VI secretion system tip protein VgrG [Pseudomonadota bacterium]
MTTLLHQLTIFSEPEITLPIQAFKSKNLGISLHYQYEILLNINNPIHLSEFIGKRAMIILGEQKIHGLITSSCDHAKTQDNFQTIRLESPLAILKYSRHNEVYLNKTTSTIIKEILNRNEFKNFQYQISPNLNEFTREYVNQYNETEFDFFHRQLANDGLNYYFEQGKDFAKLHIGDQIQKLSKSIVRLNAFAKSGHEQTEPTAHSFSEHFSLFTDHFILKDYYEETPELSLYVKSQKQSALNSYGVDYRYGTHYQTAEHGLHQIQIRQTYLESERHQKIIDTNHPNIQPGTTIQFIDHHNPDNNGDYIAVSINATSDSHKSQYHAEIVLHPINKPYHINPDSYPKPMQNHLIGQIVSEQQPYPDLDHRGYYQVYLPHVNKSTHRIRLAQPYTGSGYGFHFPLHAQTEVLLIHINGDPDRPIILGALKNHLSKSPVTQENSSQNILSTWGMNQFLMDEHPEHTHIELQTRDKALSFCLSQSVKEPGIKIHSTQGSMHCQANKNHDIHTEKTFEINVGKSYRSEVKNRFSIETNKGNITQQAGNDIKHSAGKNLSFAADTIGWHSHQMILESTEHSTLFSQGDIVCSAPSGQIKIECHKNMKIAGESIIIEQGSSRLEITNSGNILIQAPMIHLIGGSLPR